MYTLSPDPFVLKPVSADSATATVRALKADVFAVTSMNAKPVDRR